MRTRERHHLKDNELALMLGHAGDWTARNRRTLTMTVGTLALAAVAAAAYFAWQSSVDTHAQEVLAQAMVVEEARVTPPTPAPDGKTSTQQPGTYPTEKAKLEAALPKLIAAANAYPTSDAGRTARYHAAATLAELGRFDEAIKQYDQLVSARGLIGQSARLGKANAQLRAGQHDAAIATFKELSERSDTNLPKEAILLELARAYRVAGKAEDARKTLNQIVEQHAESPFAAEARKELEKISG